MYQHQLFNSEHNYFSGLVKDVVYENITTGRKGMILVRPTENTIPLVRSTTNYKHPYQKFSDTHEKLADLISSVINTQTNQSPVFNNAMIEIYSNDYKTMKYHTDQSLDLMNNSWICLFSCYTKLNHSSKRILRVKNKTDGSETDILLENNSVVFFNTETNAKHLHKIILQNHNQKDDSLWLGITFRTSKTFVNFDETSAILMNGRKLRMASEDERKHLMRMKREENQEEGYSYPSIDYTISEGDILKPFFLNNIK